MNRNELAMTFEGVGIELGVARGIYSDIILQNPKVHRLYSIDRWSDHHDEKEYHSAQRLLNRHGSRSHVIRCTFDEALPMFEEVDFIYIDGYAHTGQEGGKTLSDWFLKLKKGGIFAGHDYHPHWLLTTQAIDTFTTVNGLTFNLTTNDQYPSWWLVKP
jgi:predicted O-methyltransferase YrrM